MKTKRITFQITSFVIFTCLLGCFSTSNSNNVDDEIDSNKIINTTITGQLNDSKAVIALVRQKESLTASYKTSNNTVIFDTLAIDTTDSEGNYSLVTLSLSKGDSINITGMCLGGYPIIKEDIKLIDSNDSSATFNQKIRCENKVILKAQLSGHDLITSDDQIFLVKAENVEPIVVKPITKTLIIPNLVLNNEYHIENTKYNESNSFTISKDQCDFNECLDSIGFNLQIVRVHIFHQDGNPIIDEFHLQNNSFLTNEFGQIIDSNFILGNEMDFINTKYTKTDSSFHDLNNCSNGICDLMLYYADKVNYYNFFFIPNVPKDSTLYPDNYSLHIQYKVKFDDATTQTLNVNSVSGDTLKFSVEMKYHQNTHSFFEFTFMENEISIFNSSSVNVRAFENVYEPMDPSWDGVGGKNEAGLIINNYMLFNNHPQNGNFETLEESTINLIYQIGLPAESYPWGQWSWGRGLLSGSILHNGVLNPFGRLQIPEPIEPDL